MEHMAPKRRRSIFLFARPGEKRRASGYSNQYGNKRIDMAVIIALAVALAAGGGALGLAIVLRETFAPSPDNKDRTATPPPSVGTVASSLPSAPDIFIYYAYSDRVKS